LDKFLDVAKRAALEAGEFLLNNLDGAREVHYKDAERKNPSSTLDKGAEDIILGILSSDFPEHSFISEEAGEKGQSSEYTWLIDPLDGTVNYIHKHRYFGVSLALAYRQDIILGVIYNPDAGEMFAAVKGEGAYLNDKRIQVSAIAKLNESLLSMGFPYDRSSEAFGRSGKYFVRLARDSQALRRDGSTALALCSVAHGIYDGFCVEGNELWDYAAGILIVAEAGGRVTDFRGETFHINGNRNEVLATNGKIHDAILKCLQDEGAP